MTAETKKAVKTETPQKRHKRNTEGLRQHAREKHDRARYKCEQAIKGLLRERKKINFKRVADAANVSPSWLYKQKDLREQIAYLRHAENSKIIIPKNEQANLASKNQIIAALRLRISTLEAENRDLRQQHEVLYGELDRLQ